VLQGGIIGYESVISVKVKALESRICLAHIFIDVGSNKCFVFGMACF
jgi:hypothetical protein